MINQNHPIIPPPELVRDWARYQNHQDPEALWRRIATLAARWGADQELEACLRLVEIDAGEDAYDFARYIRTARRPKSPSLKEQALADLDKIESSDRGGYAVADLTAIRIKRKRDRIKAGSGESMRKPGAKGAPGAADFKQAAKTAKKK